MLSFVLHFHKASLLKVKDVSADFSYSFHPAFGGSNQRVVRIPIETPCFNCTAIGV